MTPFRAKWYEKTYYELAQLATAEAHGEDSGKTEHAGEATGHRSSDSRTPAPVPRHPAELTHTREGARVERDGRGATEELERPKPIHVWEPDQVA